MKPPEREPTSRAATARIGHRRAASHDPGADLQTKKLLADGDVPITAA